MFDLYLIVYYITGDKYGLSLNKGQPFSTYDRDRDGFGEYNCAVILHGGWWYGGGVYCAHVNLNGHYSTPGTTSRGKDGWSNGMFYADFNWFNSLKSSKIMLRRK